jgi:TPP-dependent 2-oxoacid decarboxylase
VLDSQSELFNMAHLLQSMNAKAGETLCLISLFCFQVRCEEELIEAIETATGAKKDCLCFIEVIVHKDDTSKELLEWGSRVAAANGRPPNPQ